MEKNTIQEKIIHKHLQPKTEEEMNEISIKGIAFPKWKLYPFTTHHCVW